MIHTYVVVTACPQFNIVINHVLICLCVLNHSVINQ